MALFPTACILWRIAWSCTDVFRIIASHRHLSYTSSFLSSSPPTAVLLAGANPNHGHG